MRQAFGEKRKSFNAAGRCPNGKNVSVGHAFSAVRHSPLSRTIRATERFQFLCLGSATSYPSDLASLQRMGGLQARHVRYRAIGHRRKQFFDDELHVEVVVVRQKESSNSRRGNSGARRRFFLSQG